MTDELWYEDLPDEVRPLRFLEYMLALATTYDGGHPDVVIEYLEEAKKYPQHYRDKGFAGILGKAEMDSVDHAGLDDIALVRDSDFIAGLTDEQIERSERVYARLLQHVLFDLSEHRRAGVLQMLISASELDELDDRLDRLDAETAGWPTLDDLNP